ncbi:hypothetical protein N7532_003682 [Penicillium argentinense]|uniref:Uncharacterized protein n=1 Tax=Penicillium argentinense TaxID=1131581 RepID=A0A9W9KEX2_9EURO|nr:uncharacterized protein N7532_003682 [Penicillium argentinense]KAJ5103153.1 hypothetical protein N7532_003682 [Penicillium argentinense]
MCSGTESPLLALDMVQRAGLDFEFIHLFSCEIEPFKQAYIERTFSPPILFRDITELSKKQAHTAYGALKKVPSGGDLLIAGTSCVDFSRLNSKRKGLDDEGQSGRTFRGLLGYVKNQRPTFVILENIKSAPWEEMEKRLVALNYEAFRVDVDTKDISTSRKHVSVDT